MVAVAGKPAAPAKEAGPLRRALAAALSDVLSCLPALLLAWLCLRVAETWHAAGGEVAVSSLFGPALANDLLSLLRYGFVLVLVAPLLALVQRQRWRMALLGAVWSLLLAAEAGLLQYQWIAGVPLGADLFGYTRAEVSTTVAGGWRADPALVLALVSALAVLWVLLNTCMQSWWPRAGARATLVAGAASLLAFAFLPDHFTPAVVRNEAGADYLLNKAAYFADRNLAHLATARAGMAASAAGQGKGEGKGGLPWAGQDARYPFLHPERTPDTLGPLFERRSGTPPNLVFIIVEGLGRNFSGPGARLGSFTPFLDELAGRSLYFENFLSGQGRTFSVLTTIFGSLPFGENGLAALGERMPRHASLLSVLKAQGYRLRFYSGSNLEFDKEGEFLRREGVDSLVSERDFGPPARRSNEWGYADGDLVDLALDRERKAAREAQASSLAIVQTTSMHDPFTFPDRPRYLEKVGQRLAQLGINEHANPAYAAQRQVFASILYTDDALRRFFEGAARLPGYENTVFVITGDHRLPELPMDTRIERYHVPLIVYSPLLKQPRAVKAVSSQFDIAPSLLAWLSNNYGLKSPPQVTWLGTGLDPEPAFRNLHAIPLKQTKTELSDFVSGSVYLAQGQLYALADGMRTDRAPDAKALATARAQFQAFQQANGMAGRAAALAPAESVDALAPYRPEARSLRSVALAAEGGGVGVSGVRRGAASGPNGEAMIEALMRNDSTLPSRPLVPLLVISDAAGLEVGESAGQAQTLEAGAVLKLALPAKLGKLPHGTYYVSVIPSHPETGRSIGIGQYHVEMKL
jgi:phosphoglycerol transferase MdoB-like AlkP superfamily enzyme